ncbi:hypothetical protein PVAND_016391 [Polypedilum vanderplanki]|uniref:Uncharacterized protein n=1 Tax=Polypedilum vanderplanki TaxID=319348 RepID=A0A9J6BG32_POLVA|nr:hypothetical protein PVAND_016391 [Polypedilum vanderplanki]
MERKSTQEILKIKRKKSVKEVEKLIPEQDRFICGTICVCQMILMFSCAAMIYLTVAIHVPAYKAFNSGIEAEPVMCVTTNNDTNKKCLATTCKEWCFNKGEGPCNQINVTIRHSGSALNFLECKNFSHIHCNTLDVENTKTYKCILKQCYNISGTFNCTNGLCQDISNFFKCKFRAQNKKLNCSAERGHFICMEMNGIVYCRNGFCLYADKIHGCKRKCKNLITAERNVVLISGDDAYGAICSSSIEVTNKTQIWNATENKILMASCYKVRYAKKSNFMHATDCVDGAFLPSNSFLPSSSFDVIANKFYNKSTKDKEIAPFENDLIIDKNVLLMINLEGCVNTLRNDCANFFKKYGKDGKDHNAASRFPCYYTKENTTYAVVNFDLDVEYRNFLIALIIPSIFLITSCIVLTVCRCCVIVGDDTKMRFKWKTDAETGKLNSKKFKNVKKS